MSVPIAFPMCDNLIQHLRMVVGRELPIPLVRPEIWPHGPAISSGGPQLACWAWTGQRTVRTEVPDDSEHEFEARFEVRGAFKGGALGEGTQRAGEEGREAEGAEGGRKGGDGSEGGGGLFRLLFPSPPPPSMQE